MCDYLLPKSQNLVAQLQSRRIEHIGHRTDMRIVHTPDEFVESFLATQREEAASFGVNTILLEKYITWPRHIEVQIFGDKHENVLHLYERLQCAEKTPKNN